MKSQTYILD